MNGKYHNIILVKHIQDSEEIDAQVLLMNVCTIFMIMATNYLECMV